MWKVLVEVAAGDASDSAAASAAAVLLGWGLAWPR